MVLGHLKAGVTPAQAIADLNSIGAYLEKTYPKDDGQMTFSLARPGLAGDWFGRPLRAFLTGLMLLAGLILLAACANLGSLFAARAADRSREVALRLALGSSRKRILRQLFTEAVLISLVGGAVGLWGSVALLRGLSAWQPFPRLSHPCACEPGRKCLCSRFAVGFSEWIPVWRGPGEADTPHESVSGRQVGIERQGRAADYCPGPVAGGANCHLRGAGHFFDGRGAWTGALAAQQLRF